MKLVNKENVTRVIGISLLLLAGLMDWTIIYHVIFVMSFLLFIVLTTTLFSLEKDMLKKVMRELKELRNTNRILSFISIGIVAYFQYYPLLFISVILLIIFEYLYAVYGD